MAFKGGRLLVERMTEQTGRVKDALREETIVGAKSESGREAMRRRGPRAGKRVPCPSQRREEAGTDAGTAPALEGCGEMKVSLSCGFY